MDNKCINKIKVLVVDDSAFMRKVISDILESDSSIEVLGTAKSGIDALEKVKKLKPDVVTLDIKMPGMDGLECLEELNKVGNVPVVMLSSITQDATEATIQALEKGAIDFITKPDNIFDINSKEKKEEIIEKVKIAGRSVPYQKNNKRVKSIEPVYKESSTLNNIVLIGTSTGGPKALQEVIPALPEDVNAAFLVVQHMPPGFTKSLAERLDGMSKVRVKEAENGEPIKTGYVYIAPGDYHMLAERDEKSKLKIKLTKDPRVGRHRPSVDVLLESVSNTGFENIVAVIMTGMGGDGSEGIKKLKENKNVSVIAQDEKTCVVFGMPKAAIQTGVVDIVTPLSEISNEIMKIVGVQKQWT